MRTRPSKAHSQRARTIDPYERDKSHPPSSRQGRKEVKGPLASLSAVPVPPKERLFIRLPPKFPGLTANPTTWSRRKGKVSGSELEQLRNKSPEIPLQLTNTSHRRNDTTDDFGNTEDIFDPFNYSTDRESLFAIKSSVDGLNYLIDNAISNVLSYFSSRKKRFTSLEFSSVMPSHVASMKPYYGLLLDHGNPGQSYLLDAFMHDEVLKFLFNTYFQGNYFYGLDSDVTSLFEDTFARIRERESWLVAQRWRSITVSSTFPDDTVTVSQTEDLLQILKQVLCIAYPTKKPNFRNMVTVVLDSEKQNIHRFVCMARTISEKIQCDVLSCRIRVTIAPKSDYSQEEYCDFDEAKAVAAWKDDMPREGDRIMFTFSFGLEYESETETKAILLPEVVTSGFLRNFNSKACK